MTSARSFEAAARVPRDFAALRVNRLATLGLVVAALGWIVLVGAVAFADRIGQRDLASGQHRLHADFVAIAESLIGSGFALALIGTLRAGFGALDRFFTAALDRSVARSQPAPSSTPPEATLPEAAMTEPSRMRRPYTILADGSVEVETIFGTRRFASMTEAQDFI